MGTDKHCMQTDRHINTMTRPGIRARPSENIESSDLSWPLARLGIYLKGKCRRTAMHCTAAKHCTSLQYTALYYTEVQYTTMHYTTLFQHCHWSRVTPLGRWSSPVPMSGLAGGCLKQPGMSGTAVWKQPGMSGTAFWKQPGMSGTAFWKQPGTSGNAVWKQPGMK